MQLKNSTDFGENILNKEVIDWLLEGPVWLKYAVELQLMDAQPDVKPVLQDTAIAQIVSRLKDNQVGIPALKTGKVHYTETGKAYWDLFFLADIGLTINDLGLEREAAEILRFQASDGTFVIPPNVRDNYFCMSAILVSSLARMGYRDDLKVDKYIRVIMSSRGRDGGWHCYNDDFMMLDMESCPMDNLNILMLLGQYDKYREYPILNGHLGVDRDIILYLYLVANPYIWANHYVLAYGTIIANDTSLDDMREMPDLCSPPYDAPLIHDACLIDIINMIPSFPPIGQLRDWDDPPVILQGLLACLKDCEDL